MYTPKFNVGDKVRCISRDNGLNLDKVRIGEVYTVVDMTQGGKRGWSPLSDGHIHLQEIEDAYADADNWGYLFHVGNFELAEHHDANEAWDRAFKGM